MWKDEIEGNPGEFLENRGFGVERGEELECCYSEREFAH